MAHMYPESIDDYDKVPDSEKEVFWSLASLGDDYHVFHSVTYTRKGEGECDFIIYNPAMGFIALEVKGGDINHDSEGWYSVSGAEKVYDIKDPVRQAQKAMRTFRDFYIERHGSFQGTWCWGVAFPDIEWTGKRETLDLPAVRVLDNSAMEKPGKWVHDLFMESGWHAGRRPAGKAEADAFISMMNKDVEVPLSLKKIMAEQEEEIERVNLFQDYLLDIFEDKKRIAFQGAAGTGKTWLLVKKARRLAEQGMKTAVLCYNNQIADFISAMTGSYKNVKAATFHSFANEILVRHLAAVIEETKSERDFFQLIGELSSLSNPDKEKTEKKKQEKSLEEKIKGCLFIFNTLVPGKDYGKVISAAAGKVPDGIARVVEHLLPGQGGGNDYFSDRVPLALLEVFETGNPILGDYSFDAVIIDEGQDFHQNWCDCVEFLARKNNESIFYIGYDDNQTIFASEKDLPVTSLIAETGLENHVFRLRDNLRNTGNIHRYAVNQSGRGATARPLEITGLDPEEETFTDESRAREYVFSKLSELMELNRIPKEKIVVLSNRSMEKSIFSGHKTEKEISLVASGEGSRKGAVRFRTIHQFKGLEADVVIMVIHERPQDGEEYYRSRELLYVGYTRARHLLNVVRVG